MPDIAAVGGCLVAGRTGAGGLPAGAREITGGEVHGERIDHRRGIVNYGETHLRRYASRPFAREEAVVPERLDVPVRIRGGGLGGTVITALGRIRGGGLGGTVITALGRMRGGGLGGGMVITALGRMRGGGLGEHGHYSARSHAWRWGAA